MAIDLYLQAFGEFVQRLDNAAIEQVTAELYRAYQSDRMVFIIGNGGSAANASHFAQDLAKGVFQGAVQQRPLRALSLTDNVSYISAIANDDGYDRIFETQLQTFGKPRDLLVAISGSGNSANIIRAVQYAREKSIRVIGFTGYDGGALRELSDISMHINLNEMCTVESMHSLVCHLIVNELRAKITGQKLDLSCFYPARAASAS